MITIRRLTPDLFPDYVKLHESLSFEHAPEWRGCYCYFYHSQMSFKEWVVTTADAKKELVKKALIEGRLHGFLAYEDNQAIGWLNVNDLDAYVRLSSLLEPYKHNGKVALSICFLIEKDRRGQGLASRLLDAAIAYYRDQGYDSLMALPLGEDEYSPREYRGPHDMYIRRGYQDIGRNEGTAIMRLLLK